MKFILVVLSVVLMNQASYAGVLSRFRRDVTEDGLESMLVLFKTLATATGPMVTSVLEQVPKTEAYTPYRKELADYLDAFEEYKTKKGLCLKKSTDLLEKFSALVEKYEKEDGHEEAKKIDELFNNADSEKLEAEIDEYVKKIDAMSAQNSNEVDTATLGVQFIGMMFAVC